MIEIKVVSIKSYFYYGSSNTSFSAKDFNKNKSRVLLFIVAKNVSIVGLNSFQKNLELVFSFIQILIN